MNTTSPEPIFTLYVKQYVYTGTPEDRTDEARKMDENMLYMGFPLTGTVDEVMQKAIANVASLLLAISDPDYNKPNYDFASKLKALVNRATSEQPPLT